MPLLQTNEKRSIEDTYVAKCNLATRKKNMGTLEKIYQHILFRRSDSSVPFDTLCVLLNRLGFDERVRGSHHIFTREGLPEILNLQPKDGKAKPYQVKQVRDTIVRYGLRLEDEP